MNEEAVAGGDAPEEEAAPAGQSGAGGPTRGSRGVPLSAEAASRFELERALAEEVEALSDISAHLGRTFAAGHDLHDTDFRALSLIHIAETRGESMSPAELGRRLDLSSGAVTYLIDRLERGGHVIRARDPRDGRRVVLRYADHGREVATAFFRPFGRHQHEALADVDDADLATTRRVLAAVTAALRTYDAELTAQRRPRKGR